MGSPTFNRVGEPSAWKLKCPTAPEKIFGRPSAGSGFTSISTAGAFASKRHCSISENIVFPAIAHLALLQRFRRFLNSETIPRYLDGACNFGTNSRCEIQPNLDRHDFPNVCCLLLHVDLGKCNRFRRFSATGALLLNLQRYLFGSVSPAAHLERNRRNSEVPFPFGGDLIDISRIYRTFHPPVDDFEPART